MDSWSSPAVPVLPGTPVPLALYDSARQGVFPSASSASSASMYVCGITPYDATHLGHAATMLAFDVINRIWRDNGLDVRYVQNVTDIDDPLLERATRDGEDWIVLAMRETALFREDMEALRIVPPAANATPSIRWSGVVPATVSRRGPGERWARGGPAGTSNAPSSRSGCSARESTCRAVATICCSRITRCPLRTPR